jgi:putative transposase
VSLDLREHGQTCSKHRLARLMRENGLRAPHGYRTRHIPAAKPQALIPTVLQRQFNVSRPNEVWATDMTYIRTWQGWLYLAVVLDLFSSKIVGWSVRPTIRRELVLEAVMEAVSSANCWDNAVAESFFSSLKKERIKKRIYTGRNAAASDVSDHIEGFYNPRRRHSHLGGVSPDELEAVHRRRRSGVH